MLCSESAQRGKMNVDPNVARLVTEAPVDQEVHFSLAFEAT